MRLFFTPISTAKSISVKNPLACSPGTTTKRKSKGVRSETASSAICQDDCNGPSSRPSPIAPFCVAKLRPQRCLVRVPQSVAVASVSPAASSCVWPWMLIMRGYRTVGSRRVLSGAFRCRLSCQAAGEWIWDWRMSRLHTVHVHFCRYHMPNAAASGAGYGFRAPFVATCLDRRRTSGYGPGACFETVHRHFFRCA